MDDYQKQSIAVDTLIGLLVANFVTIIVGLLWIYVSPSLSVIVLIFGVTLIGAGFMETRPRLTMSCIFIFIYAGFGVFMAEKYWVASEGEKVRISVRNVTDHPKASQFEFTDGEIKIDLYGIRKFCGRSGTRQTVARPCTNYFVFPFVPADWKKNDPVTVWAVFKDEEILVPGKGLKNPSYRQAISAPGDMYEGAAKHIVKSKNLKAHPNARILRFVSNATEAVKERLKNTMLFFAIGSGGWLFLFPLHALWSRAKERREESAS
jgi:cell division protein FtsW (lipid II flippase)